MYKRFLSYPEELTAMLALRGLNNDAEKLALQSAMARVTDKQKFLDKLLKSELLSICFPALASTLPQSYIGFAKQEKKEVETRIADMFEQLGHLGHRFNAQGLKVVALKNGGLAQFHLDDLGSHPMGDIDLMVSKSSFLDAHQEIIDAGFVLEFRSEYEEDSISAAYLNGGAEYSKKLDSGCIMWLELSYRSVSGRWINQDKEPRADDFLLRSIPAPISGIHILSPEDNLLQVSIHTAKHTYFRAPGIRLHLDVHRVCGLFDIDWELFEKRVLASETQTAVYFSLLSARELLGTGIPDCTMTNLKPTFWKIVFFNYFFRNVRLGERFIPNRIGFIAFQVSLYDSLENLIAVLIPKPGKVRKLGQSLFFSYLVHFLDLIGIRKIHKK
tara:strand:+ start:4008 stop:5165 length:1158 start_codon:yes stop_codon:yes gene_type:complete